MIVLYGYIKGWPKVRAWFAARRTQGRANRRATAKRQRRVELAAAEAANDDDPLFAPDIVRPAAANLFTQIQAAWSRDDRIALRGLVAPELLEEWERRLDDLRSKGWTNTVEVLDPPVVQYVGLKNRGHGPDEVTVRIDARLRDYVVDRNGRRIKRSGELREVDNNREFWTLQRRDDHWILASIEQGAEGSHALDEHDRRDRVVRRRGSAGRRARRGRGRRRGPGGRADRRGRGPPVRRRRACRRQRPERRRRPVRARHPGGRRPARGRRLGAGSRRQRRGPAGDRRRRARSASSCTRATRAVAAARRPRARSGRSGSTRLDAAAEPPTMTIDVDLAGRRYIQDRDTTAVLSGSQSRRVNFTERWTLALTGDQSQPWRIRQRRQPRRSGLTPAPERSSSARCGRVLLLVIVVCMRRSSAWPRCST